MVAFKSLADTQALDKTEEFENSEVEEDAHAPFKDLLKWYVLSGRKERNGLQIM